MIVEGAGSQTRLRAALHAAAWFSLIGCKSICWYYFNNSVRSRSRRVCCHTYGLLNSLRLRLETRTDSKMAAHIFEDYLSTTQIDQLEGEHSRTKFLFAAVLTIRLESSSQLPPSLFRAYSVNSSRGVNNENEMRPIPARTLPRRSIFARPRQEIKSMLRTHLLWEYHNDSDFIS